MYNKHIVRSSIQNSDELGRLTPEKYDRQKSKSTYIQALIVWIFYDIIRQNIVSATIKFYGLIFKCD